MICDLITDLGALILRALVSLFAMEAFVFCRSMLTLKVITATGISRTRAPTFNKATLRGVDHANCYRDSNELLRTVDPQFFHNAILVIVYSGLCQAKLAAHLSHRATCG